MILIPEKKRFRFLVVLLFLFIVKNSALSLERVWLNSFSGNHILYFTPPGRFQILSAGRTAVTEFETSLAFIDAIKFNSQDTLLLKSENLLMIDPERDGTFSKLIIPEIRRIESFSFSKDFFAVSANRILKINPNSLQKTVLYNASPKEPEIKDFVFLPDNRVVIAHKNSWELSVIDLKLLEPERKLEEHRAGIFSLSTDRRGNLYSTDESGTLKIWKKNLSESVRTFNQIFPSNFTKITSADYDGYQDTLLFEFETDRSSQNQIALKTENLLAGDILSKSIDLENISDTQLLYRAKSEEQTDLSKNQNLPPVSLSEGPDYLTLAQMEIENGNFLKAGEFVRKISEDAPNYPEARKLAHRIRLLQESRQLFRQGERNLKIGKTDEAMYFFEKVLEKDPENKKAKEYLFKHRRPEIQFFSDQIFYLLIGVIIGGVLWIYRNFFYIYFFSTKKKSNPPPKKESKKQSPPFETQKRRVKIEPKFATTTNSSGKKLKSREQKRFEQLVRITKSILQNSMDLDSEKLFESSWKTIYREINHIEKLEAEPDTDYSSLIITLNQIQMRISQLQENLLKKNDAKQATTEPPKTTVENYYEILGISKNSSSEEIKKAYRKKAKEYHPDKHQNTNFEWVKQEAEKKMLLLQKALETLSDPKKRTAYDRKLST